jgi:chaperone required for assembly of F1-ATPase
MVRPGSTLVAAHKNALLMRDIFTEIFENQPVDPMVSARRGSRPSLRKRFYSQAHVGEGEGGFPILLDGKPVMTTARHALAAPARALAEQIAQEWNSQTDVIDPAHMPLTRLANAVIDAVAAQTKAVAEEVAKYLGSDLLCYRADAPAGLVARQAQAWDPVLAWAQRALGARFVPVAGVTYVAQPNEAIAVACLAIPMDANNVKDIWRLGAVAAITTLTGSGLLALALAHGQLDAQAAWAIAHVDEDWQMEYWGRDEVALARRAFRHAEFAAAVAVLRHVSNPSP